MEKDLQSFHYPNLDSSKNSPRIVEFDTFGKTPGYAAGVSFQNNVIVNLGGGRYAMGGSQEESFDHNCFFATHPEGEPEDPAKLTAEPLLADPGKGGAGLDGAAGYMLRPGSPCRDSGVPIPGNGGRDY